MIASNQIRVLTSDGRPLYIAPYSETELANFWPQDTTGLLYPTSELEALRTMTLDAFISNRRNNQHFVEWGIYPGEVATENFIGTISLSEGQNDERTYTRLVRTVGTSIMRADARGKGDGSLAKLAVMTHALEDNTLVLQAFTSQKNEPAQKSLRKAGFVYAGSENIYKYPGGEQTQQWVFAAPRATDIVSEEYRVSPDDLKDGWRRYELAAQAAGISPPEIEG